MKNPKATLWLWPMMWSLGCGDPDARLHQLAEQSLRAQAEQNQRLDEAQQRLAEQSKELTQQSRALTESAGTLVKQEAEARKEMILAHKEMRGELQVERVGLDQQRHELEVERKTLAQQRILQPMVAEALQGIGLLLAAMTPLFFAVYLLFLLHRATENEAAINEMMILDLTSAKPRFLPGRSNLSLMEDPATRAALPAPETPSAEEAEDTEDSEDAAGSPAA